MLVRNSLVVFGSAAVLWSCASVKTQTPSITKSVSVQQVEQIALGAQSEEVLKAFGVPSERRSSGDESIWIYDSVDGQKQRASLALNKDNKLVSKTLIPEESEPESRVEYLLKSKFPKNQFRKVNFPQCGMDYISQSSVYVDVYAGVALVPLKPMEDLQRRR